MNKAEKTKQLIVEKTAPVFNKKGYAGTSMTDLTKATGLTKGSIYGNFANKDEVALAVFDYNLSLLIKGIDAATRDHSSPVDKLLKMVSFYRSQFRDNMTRGGCPILNTAVDADDTHPALKDRVAGSIRAWKKNIEKVVRQGIDSGEIRPGADGAAFAVSCIALIEGGIMLSKATGDPSMLNTCISRIETMIISELKM